jgi:serine/threonine-protein kinase
MTTPDGTTRLGESPTPRRTPADGRFVAGTVLAGRYRVVSLLGRGGMGEVYKADDLTLDHPVALKFLPDSLGLSPSALARFHGEVRIARQVSHPNVCRVYDVGEVDGLRFLTMEFIDGEDLSSLLRRISRLPGDKAVEIARQLCAGLAAAHDAGVIHRDLKPANVMIDGRGRARITDFGVAAIAREVRGTDALAGTPAYMAPEQLRGQDASVRSDVYGLGLVLYELFTGKRAIDAQNVSEALLHHSTGTPVTTPSSWTADINPAVERTILRCLEADPNARPASAIQVAAALPGGDPLQAALAAGETPSPEMVAAAGTSTAMRPAAAVALVAAIIGLLAGTSWFNRRQSIVDNVRSQLSVDVLTLRSREMLKALGYGDRLRAEASGFRYDSAYMMFDRQRGVDGRIERLLIDRPSTIEFWYRESPEPLVVHAQPLPGGPPRVGRATLENPPPDGRGMRYVVTDIRGRLIEMRAVPPEFGVIDAGPVNWELLFAAAGLDSRAFQPAPPEWTPPDASDERVAWTGVYPEQPGIPVRLEAAAYKGRVVAFRTLGPWDLKSSTELTRGQRRGMLVGWFIYTLSIGGLILAWINVRLGRGDKPGAWRLGMFILIASVMDWALSVDHVAGPGELMLFRLGMGTALVSAVSAYVVYLALEPHVRRRWPQVLISWSRVLAGRLRDPLVGRDILMGIAIAAVWTLVFTAGHWWFGRITDGDMEINTMLSVRRGIGALAEIVGNAAFASVILCFFVLVMRVLFRSAMLAALATIAVYGFISATGAPIGNVSDAILGAATGAAVVLALFRFGMLALAAFIASHTIYTTGAFTLLAVVAAAAYAAYVAIGRPPILPRRQTSQTN